MVPGCTPVGRMEHASSYGEVTFVVIGKLMLKVFGFRVVEEEVRDIFKMRSATMTVGLDGKTPIRKGGISRQIVVVKEPEEEFDFVVKVEFPNPSQGNIVVRGSEFFTGRYL